MGFDSVPSITFSRIPEAAGAFAVEVVPWIKLACLSTLVFWTLIVCINYNLFGIRMKITLNYWFAFIFYGTGPVLNGLLWVFGIPNNFLLPTEKEAVIEKIRPEEGHELPKEQVLSPFDLFQARFTLMFGFYYKTPLDVPKVIAALRKVLVRYPFLCGTVKYKDNNFVVDMSDPFVYVCHNKRQVEENSEKWIQGDLPWTGVVQLPFRHPTAIGQHMFVIKITQCKEGKGTLMTLCNSHCLMDMHTHMLFMRDWQKAYFNEEYDFENEDTRGQLILDPETCDHVPDEEGFQLGFQRASYMFNELEKMINVYRIWRDPLRFKRWEWTDAQVAKLKESVMAGPGGQGYRDNGWFLSTNDIISAICWKACAMAYALDRPSEDEDFPFKTIFNFRFNCNRISNMYAGNATTTLAITLTLRELRKLSISEIAFHVRKHTVAYDDKKISRLISWTNAMRSLKNGGVYNWLNIRSTFPPVGGRGVSLNSWLKFDVFGQFNGYRPKFLFPYKIFARPGGALLSRSLVSEGVTGIQFVLLHHRYILDRIQYIDPLTGDIQIDPQVTMVDNSAKKKKNPLLKSKTYTRG